MNTAHQDDVAQIDKDVTNGRTLAECFRDDKLKHFLGALEKTHPDIHVRVKNVLVAYCNRNPVIGYVQVEK